MSIALESHVRPRVAAAQLAVFSCFFAFGIGTGLWGGSMPEVVRQAGVSPRLTGIALTLYILAYIVTMSGGGWLSRRISLRRILVAAVPAQGAALAVLMQAASPVALVV